MSDFEFMPSKWFSVQDKAVLEHCRNIKREEMEYTNENGYTVCVIPKPCAAISAQLFQYLYRSDVEDRKTVIVFPNWWSACYTAVTNMCNRFNVNCRNVYTFCLDEWADETGTPAPITFEHSLGSHFLRDFYLNLREDLRPPLSHIHYFTKDNVNIYSDILEETTDGKGADLLISATGWVGHTAFVDPGTQKFKADTLEEFLTLKSGVVDNCRLTVIQNSTGLGGGDYYNTPRYSVSVGPYDIHHAQYHLERHDIAEVGGYASWERMVSRLQLYGPVSMDIPASIFQLTPGTVYVSEDMAKPIQVNEFLDY